MILILLTLLVSCGLGDMLGGGKTKSAEVEYDDDNLNYRSSYRERYSDDGVRAWGSSTTYNIDNSQHSQSAKHNEVNTTTDVTVKVSPI